WITGSYVAGIPAANTFEACRRRGARCAIADDVDEFELIPEDWGYPGAKIRDAIEAFNVAARDGFDVSPSREFDRRPLDQPPYYVIEAAPAITLPWAACSSTAPRGCAPGMEAPCRAC